MWGWNVVQLDMACVVNGMLVWVQLHSKDAMGSISSSTGGT